MIEEGFRCRGCGSTDAHVILDMGKMPLANAFVTDESDDADAFRAPLSLVMCEHCNLIQLGQQADREQLFRNYLWVTGTSDAAARHAPWLSQRLAERYLDADRNLLVEIASNDGFFLQHYRDAGFAIQGVDPSNVAGEANERGLPTIQDFFGKAVAERIVTEQGKAQVVVARNVIGHSSELRDLFAGVDHLLADDGHFVIEHPYGYLLRSEVQYDQVFHEHVSYPTIQSVSNLLAEFGMKIVDIDFVNMNGGSMLIDAARLADPAPEAGHEMRAFEKFIRLNEAAGWDEFRDTVLRQRTALVDLLKTLKNEGKSVGGYGAAAKSMTMLNFCGIDTELVEVFADANPKKQGLMCPGVRIPVVSPNELLERKPDYILIGAWNLKTEIIRQLREEKGFAGKFIIPLPLPTVV